MGEEEGLGVLEGDEAAIGDLGAVFLADGGIGVEHHPLQRGSVLIGHAGAAGPVGEIVALVEGFGEVEFQTGIGNQSLPLGDGQRADVGRVAQQFKAVEEGTLLALRDGAVDQHEAAAGRKDTSYLLHEALGVRKVVRGDPAGDEVE